MQRKINLTLVICLQMRKTTETKLHRVNLKSPLPRIHYYQSQEVTSIKNLTKPFGLFQNTNLQLNLYPNIKLDLYCNNNLSVQCINSSTWLTLPTWRRCWLQSSSVHQQWRLGSSLVTKLSAQRCNSLYRENNKLGHFLHLITQCMCDGL